MNTNYASRRVFLGKTAAVIAGTAFFSSHISLGNILNDPAPFDGYNPFAEEKNDLRTGLFNTNSIKVTGKVYTRDGLQTIPNAKIEVWHLSPNSNKYRHRAKLKTNSAGEYNFITDFPNKEKGDAKIYFKVSNNDTSYFTELFLNDYGAFITGKHWEENNQLRDKLFPKKDSFLGQSTCSFNIST